MARFGYRTLQHWVQGDGFRRMLSHEVSKSMKLTGEFEPPFVLEGWTLTTPAYSGTGWPGEAIGSLDAQHVRGVFEPWGVLRGVWEVKRIDIGNGRFVLRQPDDAAKLHPIKKAPPWYAFIMPSRFYCEWIETPSADIEFAFLNHAGGLKKVHLGATMIGRDFRYFIDGGSADLPFLPVLGVDWLVMTITRDKADIEQAWLRGLNGDPARVQINARLGMRQDKSVRADVSVEQLPFSQALPPEFTDLLTGRLTGTVNWNTDTTGQHSEAFGQLALHNARLKAWAWLSEISRLHHNPELLVYELNEASCRFHFRDKRFEIDNLKLHALNKARVEGRAAYDLTAKRGELDVDLSDIPLAAWLPEEFKPRVNAELRGHLHWKGSVQHITDSEADGTLNLDNTEIRNPVRLRKLLGAHQLRVPDYLFFDRARIGFDYRNQILFARQIELHATDLVRFDGSATWTHANYLQLNLAFAIQKIASWLPKKLEPHLSGDLSGRVDWSCENGKMPTGNGSGTFQLTSGELRGFKLQQTLCRFLKTDAYLKLPLATARFDWEQYQSRINLRNINILSPGKIGIRGHATLTPDDKLSGTIKIGLPSSSLRWLPDAETTVFTEHKDGLHWATVTLSGTKHKPQHNLTAQIMHVLDRHPFALLGLAMRGLSWWLGDALGTYEPLTANN